jgi:hypothetical protein
MPPLESNWQAAVPFEMPVQAVKSAAGSVMVPALYVAV